MDTLKIKLQYWMPQHALTRLAGVLAQAKAGKLTTLLIRWFAKQYKVNMAEAKHSDPSYYQTFNDFFTRELADDARVINQDDKTLCFPADACVSQFGDINNNRLIQAKNHDFSSLELLGGDQALADEFTDGSFATLYLSPTDYHRVHMPCDGVLRKMIYIPGDLFSVNQLTAENVPNLFARNERVVCLFDTPFGPMAQILVGATIVGSIELVWAGTIAPPRGNSVFTWDYSNKGNTSVSLKKGEEMGRFKLGSTVINLFAKDAITFDTKTMQLGATTRLGQAYAHKRLSHLDKDEQQTIATEAATQAEAATTTKVE